MIQRLVTLICAQTIQMIEMFPGKLESKILRNNVVTWEARETANTDRTRTWVDWNSQQSTSPCTDEAELIRPPTPIPHHSPSPLPRTDRFHPYQKVSGHHIVHNHIYTVPLLHNTFKVVPNSGTVHCKFACTCLEAFYLHREMHLTEMSGYKK